MTSSMRAVTVNAVRSWPRPVSGIRANRQILLTSRSFSSQPWTQRVRNVLRQKGFTGNAVRQSHGFASPRQVSAQRMIWTIISANVAVFGFWQYAFMTPNSHKLVVFMKNNFLLSNENIEAGRYWTMLTSAFSHTGVFHFAFNMMAFHALAGIMTMVPGVGALQILAITATSAVGGSYFWLKTKQSQGQSRQQAALGASGAVMGIGVTAACFFPMLPMSLLFIPNVPLAVVILGYAAFDSYNLNSATSIIGHAAHLGGAMTGLAYYAAVLSNRGGVAYTIRRMMRR